MNVDASVRQRAGRWLIARLPIGRFLFDLLRVEFRALRMRAKYAVLPWRRARLAGIRRQTRLYVNVACGPQVLPGFLNIDLNEGVPGVMGWDCRAVPVSDGAAAGIRAEHFVEHLEPREELPAFLADTYRALQPGGVVRVIVPDAARFLDAYCRADRSGFDALAVPDPFPHDLPTRMDVVNHVFHQWEEHRWGYDFETLAHRLRAAGFSLVEQSSYGVCRDSRLAQDLPHHAAYSLYVDAVK